MVPSDRDAYRDPKKSSHHHRKKLFEAPGPLGIMHLCGAEFESSVSPGVTTVCILSELTPLRHSHHSSPISDCLPPLMAGATGSLCRDPILKTPTICLSHHRCFSDRLGAQLGSLRTQDLWSLEELLLHINIRELRAVRLAYLAFQSHVAGKCMSVLMDNATAMFYINRQEGARSSHLCQEVLRLWEFCIAHSIHLEASYLPGS